MNIRVDLPRSLPGEALEEACIQAAEEIGYEAKSKDNFKIGYSLNPLNPIQEHSHYEGTNISVGNLLEVYGINKEKWQDIFFVWTGGSHGTASDKEVKDYLSIVSKHLYSLEFL